MANLVESNGKFEINSIAADYDYEKSIFCKAIHFIPGAASDAISIKDKDDTGVKFYILSTDGESRILPMYMTKIIPYIDFSESTLSAGHKVIFLYEV